MKKLILKGLFLFLIGMISLGCEKEQMAPQNTNELYNSDTQVIKANGVVYANLSCELPNGQTGCQCTITQSDDDCELQTDCKAQSTLSNYNSALQAMFTLEEIQTRARNRVRITEPELIEALKRDKFPLK